VCVCVRFYRATACDATHGIAVAILSVRLSICLSDVNIIADKSRQLCLVSTQFRRVLSRLDPVSNLQLFSLKYTEDYLKFGNWKLGRNETKLIETGSRHTKLSSLVCNCADNTRQSFLSMSAV